MEMIKQKKITQREVSEKLGLSLRQVKRIYKKYQKGGDESLNHGLKGCRGNHRINEEYKQQVLKLVDEKYREYSPTFISEKLLELDGVEIRANTLRMWMIEAGYWEHKARKAKHRTRRQRKEHFGEMIQMDGSPHDWFGTGQEVCLMNMIDDSNNTEYGLFDTGETTNLALKCLYDWIDRYGVPMSIYTDHGSVYYKSKEPSLEEQLEGKTSKTRFGEVCELLGIELIFANSPQAKGRVERANGVQQDRLISEMKLRNIKDIVKANQFLKETYWDKHNEKFKKKSISDEDFHVQLTEDQDLRRIVCYHNERVVTHDFVVRIDNMFFQLEKKLDTIVRPNDKVKVQEWLDGSIHIFKNDIELSYSVLNQNTDEDIA